MFSASDGQQLTEPINETVAKQMGCTKKKMSYQFHTFNHVQWIHVALCKKMTVIVFKACIYMVYI